MRSSSFSQTKFNKTNFLIKTNKTFSLLIFDSVETNRFTKLGKFYPITMPNYISLKRTT
ncbi:MAG: hypothetical protein ACTS6H_00160 [Candidatus Hodgkinia cicadicola]